MLIETVINQPVKVPFSSINNTTGLSSFSGVQLLKDGVANPLATTFAEIGSGLYTAEFTPIVTGLYTYFIEGKIQAYIRVADKSLYTVLQTLEDVAIGSWTWDKNTGVLTFVRQNGSTLAGFSVVDNLTTANRQRTTP